MRREVALWVRNADGAEVAMVSSHAYVLEVGPVDAGTGLPSTVTFLNPWDGGTAPLVLDGVTAAAVTGAISMLA